MALKRLTAALLAALIASASADDVAADFPKHVPKGPLALRAEARRAAANARVQIPGAMSDWLGFKSGHDFSAKYSASKQGTTPKLAAVAASSTVGLEDQGNPYEKRLNGEAPIKAAKKPAAAAPEKKPKATLLRSKVHTKMTAAEKAHAFDDLELPASFGHTASMAAVSSNVQEGGNAYLASAGLDQPSALAVGAPQDDNSYVATLMGQQQQRTMKLQEKEEAPKSGNNYLDAILPAKYVGLEKQ